jgi:nucleotide-binding universal stress UspA family protein
MYKKILVPLDGSEFSETSLKHAKALATGCNAQEVILLRVIEPLHSTPWLDEIQRTEAGKKAEVLIKDYLSKVAEKWKKDNINVTTVMLKGDPASEILDYAGKNAVNFIMATRGESGVVRWLLGSVSERVVLHASVPVITVNPRGGKGSN